MKDLCTFAKNIVIMAAKDDKKEKERTARETLGKYFYDLSKTSFGTGLLGTFLPYFTKEEPTLKTLWLFFICIIATIAFAYMGNKILKK